MERATLDKLAGDRGDPGQRNGTGNWGQSQAGEAFAKHFANWTFSIRDERYQRAAILN